MVGDTFPPVQTFKNHRVGVEKCMCGEVEPLIGAVTSTTGGQSQSRSQSSQAMLRPQLLHSFLSSLKDAPPFFSPALLERWFPRKGRSSSWRGGHRRHGNAALLGPTDYVAWGCRRPRGLGGQRQQHGQLVRGGGGRLPGQGVS